MPSWILYTLVAPVGVALLLALGLAVWFGLAHRRYLRYHRRHGIEPPAFGARPALRYYLGVLASLARASWWRVRARGRRGPLAPAGEVTGPPVLCVHGYLLDDTCFWGLRQELRRHGRSSRAVFLGHAYRPLEGYAPALERALEEMVREPEAAGVDVVAHSMGGLVLRIVLARRPDLADGLRRIVTLGSPHRGTPVSLSLPVGPEVRAMGEGSRLLAALPGFAEAAPRAEATTVAAVPDLVVYPRSHAHLPGCHQVDLVGVSHLGLVTERAGIVVVLAALGAAD